MLIADPEIKFPELIRQMMAEDASDYGENVASSDPQPVQHDAQKSVGSIRSFNGLRAHPPTEEFTPQTSAALVQFHHEQRRADQERRHPRSDTQSQEMLKWNQAQAEI